MSNKMLNIVNQLFENQNNELYWPQFSNTSANSNPVNVIENDTEYKVHLQATNLHKEYFNINFDNQVLTISYKEETPMTDDETKSKDKIVIHQFKKEYSFTRSIKFEKAVNIDSIKSSLDKGVLEIILPKAEKSGGVNIDIG